MSQVCVYGINGSCWALTIELPCFVDHVKKVLEQTSGLPSREQRLLAGIVEASDGDTLPELLARTGSSFLTLVKRNPEQAAVFEQIKLAEYPQDIFRLAPPCVRESREVAMYVVARHGYSLKHVAADLRADRELVTTAVTQSGAALEFASDALRANHDIVATAVNQNGIALKYASAEMQADKEIVQVAVGRRSDALAFATKALRSDPQVVLVAAMRDWRALKHASPELLADQEFLLPIVNKYAQALSFANIAVKPDLENRLRFGPKTSVGAPLSA